MTTLYIDAFGGASGDMLLGALCDLGFDLNELRPVADALGLPPGALTVSSVMRGALACKKVRFLVDGEDLDHPASHGHDHHHDHDHPHEHHSGHGHDHHHDHDHHYHGDHEHHHHGDHEHRSPGDLLAIVDAAPYEDRIKDDARRALKYLAEAEAKIHGIDVADVLFHEVGAADSLLDVIGVCLGVARLGVTRVVVSPMPTGGGFVDCAHGRLPLPAPATLALLAGVPTRPVDADVELVTPTAAALVRVLADGFGPMPAGVVRGVGYGAGTREMSGASPNALRAILVDEEPVPATDTLVIETNIDDMNPQLWPSVSDALLAAGALDVACVPALMKRGRPGQLVQVLAPRDALEAIAGVLMDQTPTIGVRYHATDRIVAEREMRRVSTDFGEVAVKVTRHGGHVSNVQPEFADCERRAADAGVPVKVVLAAAIAASANLYERPPRDR
ncbi:nickel pincer cofactor biosynthesis protein LarC [bacterium]|nr:nickel pincer cofactor biosynthesis protein LarC [bacterium]